jgi:sister chromatid cohesion protein PDS5
MARGRRSAPADEEEHEAEPVAAQADALERLHFNEPLSWRAGKTIATEVLHNRLSRLAKELGNLDQETTDANSLTQVAKELASQQLLTHKDKGIRAFAASCLVDVLRICAPNAPFGPAQLKVCAHVVSQQP